MAKRALYQATERTIGSATDILHIGNSNKDYKITFANLCQYIWMYLTGTYFLQPAVKNISAGNQVTNLSVYEAGGASEKPNGFRIKVSWTGGVGTFFHLWTGTTYTIDGVAIADFICAGTGYVILELDKTNGNWILVQDGRELVSVTATSLSNAVNAANPIRYDDSVVDHYGTVNTGASWKFTAPKSAFYQIEASINSGTANHYLELHIDNAFANYHSTVCATAGYMTSFARCVYLAKGQYIHFENNKNTSTSAVAKINITEVR